MSPPTMNVSSSAPPQRPQQVRPCRTGPSRSASARETPRRSSPATASLAHRDAVRDARVGIDGLVRRHRDRHQQDAVEPELHERLLRADQMAEVRRVERPAEQADPRHGA